MLQPGESGSSRGLLRAKAEGAVWEFVFKSHMRVGPALHRRGPPSTNFYQLNHFDLFKLFAG